MLALRILRIPRGAFWPPWGDHSRRLLEVGQAGSEVDVKDLITEGQRRDRLDSQLHGLGVAFLVRAEVYLLDVEPIPVQRAHHRSLGGDAHGAASVVKDGPCQRLLEMTISAASDGSVEFETHPIRVEAREFYSLLSRTTTRSTDLLRACAWCNRMNVGVSSSEWVEVEEATERLRLFQRDRMPQLTHGICEDCLESMMSTLASMGGTAEPGAAPERRGT